MNEYTRIQNAKDRAAILVQLVNADARVLAGAWAIAPDLERLIAKQNFDESRAELWKLVGPAEEDATDEA